MTVNITDKHNKSKVVRETGSAAQDPKLRAKVLGLYGLLARWDEVREEPWLQELFSIEAESREADPECPDRELQADDRFRVGLADADRSGGDR
jgi:hypothetical protein